MPWMTGGGQPISAGLSYPTNDFIALTGYGFYFVIALICINGFVYKIRILFASLQNSIS